MKSLPMENNLLETSENKCNITSLKSLDSFLEIQDNNSTVRYISKVPDECRQQSCLLGIDEAGRGPVLGPMVYGIAYCAIERQSILIDFGCADSKALTEEKREAIFEEINKDEGNNEDAQKYIGWAVDVIAPNVISTNMLSRTKCSLNEISMNAASDLIQAAIDAGVDLAEVYVDTVGPPDKYQQRLKKLFPQLKITVAKKADSTYPIVSAASICAKVTRDHALKVWRFAEGSDISKDFGSGYPGDPVTKRFLRDNIDPVFGFPRLVRFSWSTAENILADHAFSMSFDETEEQIDKSKPQKYNGLKLTEFFKESAKSGQPLRRQQCRLLKEHHLDNVEDFE